MNGIAAVSNTTYQWRTRYTASSQDKIAIIVRVDWTATLAIAEKNGFNYPNQIFYAESE